jgi:hypothetical protein
VVASLINCVGARRGRRLVGSCCSNRRCLAARRGASADDGVLNATAYCPSCVTNAQSDAAGEDKYVRVDEPEVNPYTREEAGSEDEDCLCVNVWRPSPTSKAKAASASDEVCGISAVRVDCNAVAVDRCTELLDAE